MTNLEVIQSKIYDESEFDRLINRWRFKDQKIVFTNGCFDILHLGHIQYLAEAADFGDRLIVGLNSDESVKKLKGEDRPINNEEARSMILAALHFVDAVYVFKEETPLELIKTIKPDVLVKGGDWKEQDVVGADFVKSNDGEVKIIDFVEGYSTTAIAQKLNSFA